MNQTNKILNHIPLIEYASETITPIGVFFLIHGHTCSKDPMFFGSFPQKLTEMGYVVVAIDAYKHGERIEEPYLSGFDYEKTMAMLDVIQRTCIDLKNLYINHYQHIGGKLGFLGISMGGHIVFQMPKYIQKIDFLIPIIGAPDLKRHYVEMKSNLLGEEKMNQLSTLLTLLSTDDSLYDKETLMLILEGKNDTIVSYKNADDFYQRMKSKNYPNIEYIDFPVGHEVTAEMENFVFNFILKHSMI